MGQRGLEFLLRQVQLDRLVDIWNTMLELHKALNRLPVQNTNIVKSELHPHKADEGNNTSFRIALICAGAIPYRFISSDFK